jgi:hypothetical protein
MSTKGKEVMDKKKKDDLEKVNLADCKEICNAEDFKKGHRVVGSYSQIKTHRHFPAVYLEVIDCSTEQTIWSPDRLNNTEYFAEAEDYIAFLNKCLRLNLKVEDIEWV